MAKYSETIVKIPDLASASKSGSYDFNNASVKRQNTDLAKTIWSKYSTPIKKWGSLFEIPNGIIVGFIATESSGTNAPPNKYLATGLMQVTPIAFWETIVKWKYAVDSEIPPEAIASIRANVPSILNTKPPSVSSIKPQLLDRLQNNSDFNIMMGCLVLRWILEYHSYSILGLNKKSPLNKALVGYNAGAYSKVLKKQPSSSSDTTFLATNSSTPKESRGYLYKMMGINGFFSIIYIDLPKQGLVI